MAKQPESASIGRRSVMKALIAAGVGGIAGTGTYSFLYARRHLEITRTTIPASGLPQELTGLRIGLMTDIHRSLTVPREDVDAAVAAMMAEQPDLIVLGGDYVTWRDTQYIDDVADALAPLAILASSSAAVKCSTSRSSSSSPGGRSVSRESSRARNI